MSLSNSDVVSGSRQLLAAAVPPVSTSGARQVWLVKQLLLKSHRAERRVTSVAPNCNPGDGFASRGASPTGHPGHPKMSRRSLKLMDCEIFNILHDSRSDGEDGIDADSSDGEAAADDDDNM